jgi:DNA-binding NarL/FixJ family response regulator
MQQALIVEDISETGKWLLRVLLISFPDINITLCDSYRSVCDSLNQNQVFNLVLLDINLPDGNGLDLIPAILQHSPHCMIIISTIFDDDEHILHALRAGAKGYLLKDSPEQVFIQKLRGILTGDPPLSPSIARRILRHFQLDTAGKQLEQTIKKTSATYPNEAATLNLNMLSSREIEVLVLVAKGLSRKEIARLLNLSANTIARYIRDVYQKLDISSRAEAAVEACRLGLINVDQ